MPAHKYYQTRLSLSVTKKLADKINEVAEKRDTSVSALIRDTLNDLFLKREDYEPPKPEPKPKREPKPVPLPKRVPEYRKREVGRVYLSDSYPTNEQI